MIVTICYFLKSINLTVFILVQCKHITEAKLCHTCNNCSLCDRLNLRKKTGLSALSGSLCM